MAKYLSKFRVRRLGRELSEKELASFSLKDTLITAAVLALAVILCIGLRRMNTGDTYVSMIFLLAVAVVSRLTTGYVYGIIASFASVIGVNYAFTAPYFEFNFSMPGYPLTFFCMLAVAVITSAMTTQIKRQEKQRYRAQVEEMRANLLRAVSHDLRTPLTSISGAASVLATQPDMPRDRQEMLLKEISDDSQWLIRMVENLLSITRISAEPANLHKAPEAAEEVISESVRKFRKRFGHPPVEIKLPDDLLMVPMDPILIEQVLTNLLENVVYHAGLVTKIQIRLQTEGNMAVFEVSDDGVGIPDKQLTSIFDVTASHTGVADGSRCMGIGLSVCRAIICAHGGDIEAENNPRGGARFRFYLPMKEDKHESADDRSSR